MATSPAALDVPREKPSIYSKPTPEVLLAEEPSRLELEIRQARITTTEYYDQSLAFVQSGISRWIGIEQAVERRVKSLKAPEEPLTPGSLYAGVAALTGSIVARSRSLPVRILLPPLLFVGAAAHFLPHTTANVRAYLASLEDAHIPVVAAHHDAAARQAREAWTSSRMAVASGTARVSDGVRWSIVEAQRLTGLRLQEAFGMAEREGQHLLNVAKVESKQAVDIAKSKGQKTLEVAKTESQKALEVAKAEGQKALDVVKKETTDVAAVTKKEADEVRKAK